MKNIENCKLVLDQIVKHPETWNQSAWHCDTSHCFAGWAQILSGKLPHDHTAKRDARIFLGLTMHESDYYFHHTRTLDQLKDILVDGGWDGYDHKGYDCDGYDREGYDKDGLDKNNQPKPNS